MKSRPKVWSDVLLIVDQLSNEYARAPLDYPQRFLGS